MVIEAPDTIKFIMLPFSYVLWVARRIIQSSKTCHLAISPISWVVNSITKNDSTFSVFFTMKHISLIVWTYLLINNNRLRLFISKAFPWILWVIFILLLEDSLWEQGMNTSTLIVLETSILFCSYVFRNHKTTRFWSQVFINMKLTRLIF